MQIYNANALNNNQRFVKAIIIGVLSSVGIGLAYGLILSLVHIQMEIFFLAMGWCIGQVIQKYGRGVGKKFQVLGAICTFLAILIGDLCYSFGIGGIFHILFNPSTWGMALRIWMQLHLSTSISNLLGIAFRIFGIYFGYYYASIF